LSRLGLLIIADTPATTIAYSEYWWRGFCVAALVFAWRGVALGDGATRVAAGLFARAVPALDDARRNDPALRTVKLIELESISLESRRCLAGTADFKEA